jgi:signal transduction histidine kinase
MRSMAARAERMGGTLEVVSGVAGTVVTVVLTLQRS